jgi:hypothetical protein
MPKKLLYLLVALLFLAVALFFISQNRGSTFQSDLTDFAVKDPNHITKIFIADTEGKSILLKKIDNEWFLDEEGITKARKDAIQYILKVLPTLSIKAPVAKNSIEAKIKRLAISHKKIEIYLDGEKMPSKTIYLGDTTKDLYGNLALLETKKNGKGKVPYYIQSDGKRGNIRPAFFTEPLEWVHTSVFEYSPEEIESISIEYPAAPESSFTIKKVDSKYTVSNANALPEDTVDQFFTEVYLSNYEKVFYETEEYKMGKNEVDSLLQIEPFAIISVTSKNRSESIKLIRKKGFLRAVSFDSTNPEYDTDRCYGIFNKKIVLCQYYTFDKLMLQYKNFLKQ